LNGVTARSVKPDDELARVDALDRLLRMELRRFALVDQRPAAALIFGVGTSRGTNLTARRSAAASAVEYSLDHFRRRIEPKLIEQLAWQLHRDSLQYVQRQNDGRPFTT